jgi:hypothetical protein
MDPFLDLDAVVEFARASGIYGLMNSDWGWPIFEIIHYIGLTFLFGTVGLYDLRVLGLAKSIPVKAFHSLIPFGVAGFGLNVITGFCFFVSFPDQYAYNPAFQMKVLALALAGANMAAFYAFLARRTNAVGAGQDAPAGAKLAAGVSFVAWMTVLVCGRFLTFFRPPQFWCLWCLPPP